MARGDAADDTRGDVGADHPQQARVRQPPTTLTGFAAWKRAGGRMCVCVRECEWALRRRWRRRCVCARARAHVCVNCRSPCCFMGMGGASDLCGPGCMHPPRGHTGRGRGRTYTYDRKPSTPASCGLRRRKQHKQHKQHKQYTPCRYKDQQRGRFIKPGSVLVFKLEMISCEFAHPQAPVAVSHAKEANEASRDRFVWTAGVRSNPPRPVHVLMDGV